MLAKYKKEGKTAPTYDELIGKPLIIITFIYILIAIQIHIPNIETSKTFPNCIKSFNGYPILGDDMSSINYIVCIARKMKNNIYPWSTIYKQKEEKIILQMKELIDNPKYKILTNIPILFCNIFVLLLIAI